MNAAGGVNDTPVTLVTGDDGTDPEVASQTLDRLLTSDKADVIIGPAASGTALGIIDKIGSGGALTCSGSNTSADLSTKKVLKTGKGYYRRTAPPDRLQGPALAELVLSDGHSKVGILVRNDSYGVGFGKSLQKALKQGGAKIVGNVAYSVDEGASYDSDVQKIADKSPDAVIVIGFNDDGAKVVQAMIAQGIGPADTAVYTADGMQSGTFAETVDPADPSKVEGMKGTAPAASPAGVESPFQDVFAATGTDSIFSSYYYDCTILAGLAAVKAKTDDPAKLRAAFNANLKGSEDCNTFATCKDLLVDGQTIHWRGASSEFDKFGKTEPNEGVYQPWSYVAGAPEDDDPSTQIKIG
jgi:branched-chain amino acid transport system substrate-binding protein